MLNVKKKSCWSGSALELPLSKWMLIWEMLPVYLMDVSTCMQTKVNWEDHYIKKRIRRIIKHLFNLNQCNQRRNCLLFFLQWKSASIYQFSPLEGSRYNRNAMTFSVRRKYFSLVFDCKVEKLNYFVFSVVSSQKRLKKVP